MKTMKLWMCAAILFCGAGFLGSCNDNADKAGEAVTEDSVAVEEVNPVAAAVDQYLVDSIGVHYAPGEVCIPCADIVATNETPDTVQVWGDFWVFNYKIAGDTLKTVSGGSHPGMMTLKKNDEGKYVVAAFEQVEDGHGNEASAKRIFGDKYEAFHTINSNQDLRETHRAKFIADYLKANELTYKYYQDYGWPAITIPTNY